MADVTFVPGSKPIRPVRYELFAQKMATGKLTAKAAYAAIYPDASDATAETTGPKLLRASQVSDRVDYLMGKAAERVVIGLAEVMSLLHEAIVTPMNEIDEHSLLAHKKTVTVTASGAERTTVEAMSKKDAIELLGKLSGWFKAEVQGEAAYEPTEEVAKRVEAVALEHFGRRGDVERVLRAFSKS